MGYFPSIDEHRYSRENNANEPYPAKWWPAPGYSTASTPYRLLDSLDTNFKTAARAAELGWDDLWGSGTQWFHFYEAPTNGNDFDSTIGMGYTLPNVFGLVFEHESVHPYLGGVDHRHAMQNGSGGWYMRLKYDMYENPPMYWGNGDADHLIDRQSVITHEFGHVIKLLHAGRLRSDADPQTMYYTNDPPGQYPPYVNKTGTYMRTPNGDDNFALKKLYPAP